MNLTESQLKKLKALYDYGMRYVFYTHPGEKAWMYATQHPPKWVAGGNMDIDGIKVTVTGDPYHNEIEGYVRRGIKEHGKRLRAMEINLHGGEVDIDYTLTAPFERIRRITGYLVGTTDRFNNAKRAELADRVKHGKDGDA